MGVAALCWPLWSAGPEIYLTAVGLAAGGWGAGLLMGFPVHLGAVWAAESPGLAGLFNLIRGQNPQLQAALLYAPGAALALGAVGALAMVGMGSARPARPCSMTSSLNAAKSKGWAFFSQGSRRMQDSSTSSALGLFHSFSMWANRSGYASRARPSLR